MASKRLKSNEQFALVSDSIGFAEHFPSAPYRKWGVPCKESKSTNSINRRLEPEEERLAWRQRTEGSSSSRAPEVDLLKIRPRVEEAPPALISVCDESLQLAPSRTA